jgi:phosphatidate cytidylyltransferase
VLVVVVLAAAEFFNGVRKAGFQPATLLGIAAAGCIVAAGYRNGEVGQSLVLFMTVVFGLLWYLLGVSEDRPVLNLSITVLGVLYVGLLGSYAALLLRQPDGVGLLLGAVIPTVAYDVGGFVVGRNAGRSPLTSISPNKTVEGTVGGLISAVVVGAIIGASRLDPWGSLKDGIILGFVVFVAALIGDLCESLMKRDLGVKDMGDVLPGHGGVLDRFDGMLFALPAVYYLAQILLH